MPRRDEYADDEERPRLQSLAQSARSNQLQQIRGTLLAVGIIIIVFNVIDLISLPGAVRTAMAKGGMPPAAPGMPNPETFLYALGITIDGGAILVGLLFLLFGALVRSYPVPITIAALVVYVLMTLACLPIMIFGMKGFPSILGIIFRIVFIIALAGAVRTAFAYQREQRALAAVDTDIEYEDDDA